MKDLVFTWLDSHAESLALFEGEDEITLRRQGDFVLLGAQLTASHSDNTTLQNWLRLGAASLAFFQGVLSQKADSGALWLIQTLRSGQGKQHVLDCLETLLNQRDTWRATFARTARPAQNLKSTSLRSLLY